MISSLKKKEILKNLITNFSQYKYFIVFDYKGFSANEFVLLRKTLNNKDCHTMVTKKKLVEKAISDKSNNYKFNYSLNGQNLFIFLNDPIDTCKCIKPYVDQKRVSFKTFLSNEGSLFDVDYFNALCALPSENEIKSKLLMTLKAPLSKLNSVIKEPLNQIVRILNNKLSN